MTEEDMITITSVRLKIPYEVVKLAYRSQYKFIIDKIRSLDLNPYHSEEQFRSLGKTNFSLLGLGKFFCTWETMQKRRWQMEIIRQRKREKYARKIAEQNQAAGE
jgi:hypothetical protein